LQLANLAFHDRKIERLSARWWKMLIGSILLHGLLLAAVAGILALQRTSRRALAQGSPEAVMTLSLAKSAPTSRPAIPPPATIHAPVDHETAAPVSTPVVTVTPAPAEPVPQSTPPDEGVPVLAVHPKAVAVPTSPKAKIKAGLATSRHVSTKPRQISVAAAGPVAAKPSSFTAGENSFPHPPYPEEARERHEVGTVMVLVRFDGQGGVAEAAVTQSSGSSILDEATTSFIRTNWHSRPEAGETVSVPVRYSLDRL
jgi:TonB family protein